MRSGEDESDGKEGDKGTVEMGKRGQEHGTDVAGGS